MVIPVSAKQKSGLEDLLEAILLVADDMGVKANPGCPAIGTVLEGRLDKQRGPVVTALIQNGTLRDGDVVVAGKTWGKVRALEDENGQRHRTAPPATPMLVLGLHDVPSAGDRLEVVKSEHVARAMADKRQQEVRASESGQVPRIISLDDISARIREGQIKELSVVLKTDVQGSIEPIINSLQRLNNQEVKVNVIHAAAGNINESDINLALASEAIVIGFRVTPDSAARHVADNAGLQIQLYDIIYEIVSDVEKAMKGMLAPVYAEQVIGEASVRATFDISRIGRVAGCYITNGSVRRNAQVRVLRNGAVIHTGPIDSLKRFEKDVREVKQNFECGIKLVDFDAVESGDVLQFFVMERVAVV